VLRAEQPQPYSVSGMPSLESIVLQRMRSWQRELQPDERANSVWPRLLPVMILVERPVRT